MRATSATRSRPHFVVERAHRFVQDLSFGSLDFVSLSINLEDEFDRPVMLIDWFAKQRDPLALSVSSLSKYLFDMLNEGEEDGSEPD